MKFKTELHCHSTVSRCGKVEPEALVEMYVNAGYHTLVLTDHINEQTFSPANTRYTGGEDWQEKIDFFLTGYERAKAAAKGRLHVLWAVEVCRAGTRSDFLVYGLDEQFLRANPDICEGKDDEFFPRLRKSEAMIFQAHPFRNNITITKPDLLDGVEVYNAHPRQASRNDFAELWAERFHLRGISGSDLHYAEYAPGGGILTDAPITTIEELLAVLRAGHYELVREGAPGEDK